MYSNITNNLLFQLTQPKFTFGQKVITKSNVSGYVVGLDFCLETKVWSYGVYLTNRKHELIEEIWYEAEELEMPDSIFTAIPERLEFVFKVQVSYHQPLQDGY